MTIADYAQVLGFAAGSALVAGLLAAIVLRLARRAPLVVHVIVIVAAAVGAVAGGIALTAGGMYINDADTMVALSVTAASGVVSLAMALLLTLALSRDARGLGRDARRLGAGDTVEPARATGWRRRGPHPSGRRRRGATSSPASRTTCSRRSRASARSPRPSRTASRPSRSATPTSSART